MYYSISCVLHYSTIYTLFLSLYYLYFIPSVLHIYTVPSVWGVLCMLRRELNGIENKLYKEVQHTVYAVQYCSIIMHDPFLYNRTHSSWIKPRKHVAIYGMIVYFNTTYILGNVLYLTIIWYIMSYYTMILWYTLCRTIPWYKIILCICIFNNE